MEDRGVGFDCFRLGVRYFARRGAGSMSGLLHGCHDRHPPPVSVANHENKAMNLSVRIGGCEVILELPGGDAAVPCFCAW